jgi:hypothetical protein
VRSLALVFLLFGHGWLPLSAADSTRPNIVLLLADDSGWGDYSLNGNINLKTPNIDSIGIFSSDSMNSNLVKTRS